jgi:hypothetical protein
MTHPAVPPKSTKPALLAPTPSEMFGPDESGGIRRSLDMGISLTTCDYDVNLFDRLRDEIVKPHDGNSIRLESGKYETRYKRKSFRNSPSYIPLLDLLLDLFPRGYPTNARQCHLMSKC